MPQFVVSPMRCSERSRTEFFKRQEFQGVEMCRKVTDVGEVVGLSKLVRACGLDVARLLAFVADTLV